MNERIRVDEENLGSHYRRRMKDRPRPLQQCSRVAMTIGRLAGAKRKCG